MANNLKSIIEVHGNEEVTKKVDSLVEDIKYSDVTSFAKAFYENVEVTENDGVLNTWSVDNLGPKWTYLYDKIGDGSFSTESAWYPPLKFFKHLYEMLMEIDPDVFIEVTYEDETYNPIGAIVLKKDKDGTPCYYQEEDDEMEDPTEDMDWEDEEYEQAQEDFMESIYERQREMMLSCHDLVVSDGEPIEDIE